jgi:hypothetical protein
VLDGAVDNDHKNEFRNEIPCKLEALPRFIDPPQLDKNIKLLAPLFILTLEEVKQHRVTTTFGTEMLKPLPTEKSKP